METKEFHNRHEEVLKWAETFLYSRYILGSERPAYFEGSGGLDDIYHG